MKTVIESIAFAIAKKWNSTLLPEDRVDVNKLSYSLSIIINVSAVIFTSIIIGWVFNKFSETMIAGAAFMSLRAVSGGLHAKDLTSCYVLTTAIFCTIPVINIPHEAVTVLGVISLIFVVLFAPNGDYFPARTKPYLKMLSILWVCTGIWKDSQIITLSFFVQALLLIPIKRR